MNNAPAAPADPHEIYTMWSNSEKFKLVFKMYGEVGTVHWITVGEGVKPLFTNEGVAWNYSTLYTVESLRVLWIRVRRNKYWCNGEAEVQ